uniref:Uncharacterized protein n=1 Tax=Trypanosoma congolense (strain IL3000) TaxID=1068625 RepID=G0UL42_TRYCI|nr:conserved hypothetical protein [Trypanosoma congolense IL3000]
MDASHGHVEGNVSVPKGALYSSYSRGLLSPLFHFVAHDTAILAMEHNNHSKLLALSTSKNEVFVINTRQMQLGAIPASGGEGEPGTLRLPQHLSRDSVINAHSLYGPLGNLETISPVLSVANMYGCIDSLTAVGRWMECFRCRTAVQFLFFFFTMACACSKGKVLIFSRSNSHEDSVWSLTGTYSFEGEGDSSCDAAGSRSRATRGCTCINWDESGGLLAVGDGAGGFRVLSICADGQRVSGIAFGPRSLTDRGALRHVSWAPGAGRSFVILSAVTIDGVALLFFRRPLGGAVAASGLHALASERLQLLAETGVERQEMLELVWDSSGTRFVTNHADGGLSVWSVAVSYMSSIHNAMGGASSRDAYSENIVEIPGNASPVLVAHVRRVSAVNPYNSMKQ